MILKIIPFIILFHIGLPSDLKVEINPDTIYVGSLVKILVNVLNNDSSEVPIFNDMEEESIIINGKKYKPVKESTKPTIFNPKKHLLRETYERIGGK